MAIFGRLKAMFTRSRPKQDAIKADYGRALQRNEMASQKAREALEDLKMAETLRQITGRMQ